MNTFQIIMSTRLKDSAIAGHLTDFGTSVRYITLRRGEFLLGNTFGVKYLTASEFMDRIKDRSIYREVLELKREYRQPLIIVEGTDPFHYPGVSLATVHGALLFASVLNTVPIMTTANDLETAQLIFMLAAQTGNGMDFAGMPTNQRPEETGSVEEEVANPRLAIIARLPEVGPERAQRLLKHFGTLSKLFRAKIDDLKKVKGIGGKRAAKIHAFINSNKAA
jgi:Fanconi anemia group M protein